MLQARTVHPGCSGPGSSKGGRVHALSEMNAWRMRLVRVFGEDVYAKIAAAVNREQGN